MKRATFAMQQITELFPVFFMLFLLAITGSFVSAQQRQNLYFRGDFEQLLLHQYSGKDAEWHELLMVNSPHPVRLPGTALRTQININEFDVGGSKWRAQMVHDGARKTPINNNTFFMAGDTGSGIHGHNVWRWYGFSVYVPEDWQNDSQNAEIVWNLHEQPDQCEGYRVGPLQLLIDNDKFKWETFSDSRPCTPSSLEGVRSATFNQVDLEKGKWVDWVLRVRWDYRTQAEGGQGFIELWKDGVQQPTYYGPNCYNDQKPLYLKVGQYRWLWSNASITNRYLYYDEVRIGQGHARYEDVAPGSSPIGWLDSVDDTTGLVSGWSLDPDRPQQSNDVHFYIDGNFAGSVTANIPRPDVNEATGYPGNHGYNFTIPAQYLDGALHTIHAYGIDRNGNYHSNLNNSPTTFPIYQGCYSDPNDVNNCSYNGGWWNYDYCYCQY